jgi:hypothetical protein
VHETGDALVAITPEDVDWLADHGTSLRQIRDVLDGPRGR